MNLIQDTEVILNTVAAKTDQVILFYICGKDSIALLDLCSKKFKKVTCVFMYFVKDLEHINRYIRFSQTQYPNVEFIQVPHWNLTYILRAGHFCNPQPKIKLMKLADIDEAIRLKTGIAWSIFGMKKADSMNRRLMLKTYELEAINNDTNKVYPLSNWKDRDVLRYIEMNNLPKPITYEGVKRSNGVGFDLQVFLYLRKYYPGDLEKILTQFPQAGRILFDYDRQKSKQSHFSNN